MTKTILKTLVTMSVGAILSIGYIEMGFTMCNDSPLIQSQNLENSN